MVANNGQQVRTGDAGQVHKGREKHQDKEQAQRLHGLLHASHHVAVALEGPGRKTVGHARQQSAKEDEGHDTVHEG